MKNNMMKRILIYDVSEITKNNLYFINKLSIYVQKIAIVSQTSIQLPKCCITNDCVIEQYSSSEEALNLNKNFDEYIIANDTFYGPFFDIEELFKKMKNYSKWSIDKLFYDNKSFIVYKKNAFDDKVKFAYEQYIDFDYNISNYHLPFLHKFFFSKTQYNFINLKIKRVFEYIKEHSKYDEQIIYEDLEKTKQYSLINKTLIKNYIISSNYEEPKLYFAKKIAGILYIYSENLIDYCYKYALNFPERTDLYIVTTSEKVLEKIKIRFSDVPNKIIYRTQQNRGRDNTALLVTCKDVINKYDYVCFVHSKESKHNKITSHEFRNHCFNSLLYNKNYVNNLINKFEENEKLGLLIPFPPEFEPYCTIGNEWLNNFDNAKNFIKDRNRTEIELNKIDVICAFGDMFWFRAKSLKTLLSMNITFNDFEEEPISKVDGLLGHAIERLIPTLANYDGYYSAYTIPEREAGFYIDTLMYSLKNTKNIK